MATYPTIWYRKAYYLLEMLWVLHLIFVLIHQLYKHNVNQDVAEFIQLIMTVSKKKTFSSILPGSKSRHRRFWPPRCHWIACFSFVKLIADRIEWNVLSLTSCLHQSPLPSKKKKEKLSNLNSLFYISDEWVDRPANSVRPNDLLQRAEKDV